MYKIILFFLFGFLLNAQIVNIPDPLFKARLLEATAEEKIITSDNSSMMRKYKLDENNDGEIQLSEAERVHLFYEFESIGNPDDIYSIDGIESFPNLKQFSYKMGGKSYLNIYRNSHESIVRNYDLITIENLKGEYYLYFNSHSNPEIKELIIKNSPNLDSLTLETGDNRNINIKFENLPKLKKLQVSGNIDNLDLRNLNNLEEFKVFGYYYVRGSIGSATSYSIVRNLNVENLTKLEIIASLSFYNSNLPKPYGGEIKGVYGVSNFIYNVNFNGCVSLNKLIGVLTIPSNLPNIEHFWIYTNYGFYSSFPNSDITLVNLPKLKSFISNYSNITSMNFSNVGELEELDVSYNKINSIDLSNLSNLNELYLDYNYLTEIDISKNKLLTILNLNTNSISDINIKNNINLKSMYIDFNNFTSITYCAFRTNLLLICLNFC